MYNPNNDGPVSPMKKLKILSEKQNVIETSRLESPLHPIKETAAPPSTPIDQQQQLSLAQQHEDTSLKPSDEYKDEFLLEDNPGQYVIFPIQHQDMWHMYKSLVDNFWSVTEANTVAEIDAINLKYDESNFMKYFASIFASPYSRGLVNDNFAEEFCKLIQVTEAKFFYGHQLMVQNIHYEMFNELLNKFAPKFEEKEKLFKIVENFDSVKFKRDWINKWSKASFGDQIAASACLHGLMFSAIEMVRDWLKSRVKNWNDYQLSETFNRMIIDQNLQRDFDCLMLSHLKHKPSSERLLEMINEVAKLEFDFLVNGLKIELVSIELDDVLQLIDRKTRELKQRMFKIEKAKETKKVANVVEENTENMPAFKETSQKLVLDEDF